MKKSIVVFLVLVILCAGMWKYYETQRVPLTTRQPEAIDLGTTKVSRQTVNIATSRSSNFTDIQIDTSNWVIYQARKGGYAFKYPQDWFVAENVNKGEVNILSQRYPKDISIGIRPIGTIQDAEKARQDFLAMTSLNNTQVYESSSSTAVYKITILNHGDEESGEMRMFLTVGQKAFEIRVWKPDGGYPMEYVKVATGVYQTFKLSSD